MVKEKKLLRKKEGVSRGGKGTYPSVGGDGGRTITLYGVWKKKENNLGLQGGISPWASRMPVKRRKSGKPVITTG